MVNHTCAPAGSTLSGAASGSLKPVAFTLALKQIVLHVLLSVHLLEALVFFVELFHPHHQAGVHPAITLAPLVYARATPAVLATQIHNANTILSLLQDRHDLADAVHRLLHQNLLGHLRESSTVAFRYFSGESPTRLDKLVRWHYAAVTFQCSRISPKGGFKGWA